MKRQTIPVHEYDSTGRYIRTKHVLSSYLPGCVEVWTDDVELAFGLALLHHKAHWLDGNDHDITAAIK